MASLMPPHIRYHECFFGGGSVLFQKDPIGISETANDLNGYLINFWKVLQDEDVFQKFQRKVEATPFSEEVFWASKEKLESIVELPEPDVNRALDFFVIARQSFSGTMRSFSAPWAAHIRAGMNQNVSAWLSSINGLPEIHARLKRVTILNRPAVEVIKSADKPETLIYADPPYVPETREKNSRKVYQHEMTVEDHREFLETAGQLKNAKIMISGYSSELYDSMLKGWNRHDKEYSNRASWKQSRPRMVEVAWTNY